MDNSLKFVSPDQYGGATVPHDDGPIKKSSDAKPMSAAQFNCNPKALQDQFFNKHCRSLPMQSFQILHQCYHPTFAVNLKAQNEGGVSSATSSNSATEYVLILEQQYKPVYKKGHDEKKTCTIDLSEYQNYAIQNAIAEADEDEEQKDSIMSSARQPDRKQRKPDRISCTYRELARNCRNDLGITFGQQYNLNSTKVQGLDESSDNESVDSNSGAKIRTNMGGGRRGGAAQKGTIKQQSQVIQIGRSKTLFQSATDQNPYAHSTFKLTLWKVDSNEPAVILAEQVIEVSREVYILKNKIYFSQDGKYIFIVLVDSLRKLWKTIVLDGLALKNVYELEFDLKSTNIHSQDVKQDPQMVRVKEEYASQIAKGLGIDEAEATRYQNLNQRNGHYLLSIMEKDFIAICSHKDRNFKIDRKIINSEGDICKIKYLGIAIDDSEEKMVFLAKVLRNEMEKQPKLTYFLTNIQKTLQKCFQGGNPKFQDELIYSSQFNLSDLRANYRVKQAFFHKDYGLFAKVVDKRDSQSTSRSSYLMFMPRTSLFTGKDTNQACLKFTDLQIMQNPWLLKDLTFLSFYEAQHVLFLAKDWIKTIQSAQASQSVVQPSAIFDHKNVYKPKEKLLFKSPNFTDFRLNLQMGYCTLLNLSNEIFERPFLIYYLKALGSEEGGILQLIDKYEMINVNPYTVLLEDRSILNIYSYLEQDKHYRYKINEQFLSFVEITRGQISLEQDRFYRHQICMYLTLNDKNQLKLNFILFPNYSDISDENSLYRYNNLPYTFEWTKYKNQQILKAYFIQFPSQKQDNNNVIYLVIQLRTRLITINVSTGQFKSFEADSMVPILQHHPDGINQKEDKNKGSESNANKTLSFYVHMNENDSIPQQQISQLDISTNEPPRLTSILEFNSARVLKMQQINSQSLLLFDQNLQIKKYKLQQKTQKMKLTDEYRIIDDARKLLKNTTPGGTQLTIELTENAVYINSVFFQVLKKQSLKDNTAEFEESREKRVERHVNSQTLCLGPFLSADKANLTYIYKANKPMSAQAGKNKTVDTNSADGGKGAILNNLLAALLRIRERCLMKPDEPIYQVVQVPLLISSNMSLLHDDDYLKENVEYSTFTASDDILLKTTSSLLFFDKHGNPLRHYTHDSILQAHIFDTYELKQIQIVTRPINEDQQLLFDDGQPNVRMDTYLAMMFEKPDAAHSCCVLQVKKVGHRDYEYEVKYMREPFKLINPELAKNPNFQLRLKQTRLEEDGNIYQILVTRLNLEEDNDEGIPKYQDDLFFTKNGEKLRDIGGEMFRLFKQKSRITVKKKVAQTFSNNRNSSVESSVGEHMSRSALQELLLKPSQQSQESQMIQDLDFKLMPRSGDGSQQFLVFKKDLDIYYTNLMQPSMGILTFKPLHKLELDNGQITQLMSTYKSNLLQFLYVQASPLQSLVFTWDLEKNMEVQMHRFSASALMPSVYISKGVTTRENYYVPQFEENIYDLRFQFQVNYFRGDEACKGMKKAVFREKEFKKNFQAYADFVEAQNADRVDELKIASHSQAMLGLSKPRQATLQYPHSYISLQYCQYLIDLYRELESKGANAFSNNASKLRPILKYMRVLLQDENNMLHLFATNEGFLKQLLKEVRVQYIDLNDKDYLAYIYYLLLPNNTATTKGRRPFSLALKQYSPKCLEQMLETLMIDPSQDYLRYMERYLSQLLAMNSPVFYRFLDVSCKRFQFRIQGQLKKEAVFIQRPTQYINQTTFMKNFKNEVKQNTSSFTKQFCSFGCCNKKKKLAAAIQEEDEFTKEEETQSNLSFTQNQQPEKNHRKTNIFGSKKKSAVEDDDSDSMFQDIVKENDEALSDDMDNQKHNENSKIARLTANSDKSKKQASINIYSYEFETLMKGRKGDKLIKYLSNQPLQSPLFENPTIHALLDAQWQRFKWNYYMIVMLYLIGFLIMFPYFELFSHANLDEGSPFGYIIKKHYVFYLMFLPMQIAISVFLTIFEVKKLKETQDYFQVPIVAYNFIQVMIPLTDLFPYMFDCSSETCMEFLRIVQYGLNANFIILGMIVLLFKIKYLNFASFYITRFYLVIKDTSALLFIIFVTQITFAYAYKINYSIQEEHLKYGIGIVFKSFEFFKEDTYTSLWDFWKNVLINGGNTQVKDYLMFVLLVLLTAVVVSTNLMLFYFLVAAVIESYNKVSQNLKNQKYLARAKILFENSLIFRRNEVFAKTRYIIKAQAEKIDGDGANKQSEAQTIATEVSASVKTSVEQESQKSENNFKFLKNKIVKLTASQELMQQQQDNFKQDIKKMLSQMQRQLGDILARGGGGGGGGSAMPAMPAISSSAASGAAKKKDDKAGAGAKAKFVSDI